MSHQFRLDDQRPSCGSALEQPQLHSDESVATTLSTSLPRAGYGKNRDLNVPFWSTKDPGQQPFSFVIGLGQARSVTASRLPLCAPSHKRSVDRS